MARAKEVETKSDEDTEQALSDALAAAIDPFRNVLHKDRASRVAALQAEILKRDEAWTTYEGGPVPPEPVPDPTLDSLSPDTAVAGDAADITMSAVGAGFTADSIIVFNGHAEPTIFVSDTELTTGVKPSLFVVPAVCPVEIHTGMLKTAPIDFTFTEDAPAARKTSKKKND